MRCKICGRETYSDSEVCSFCVMQIKSNMDKSNSQKQENTLAVVGFVLSFFVAIAGLICSIMGYQKAVNDGAPYKGLALAGIILSIFSMIWTAAVIIISCAAYVAAF